MPLTKKQRFDLKQAISGHRDECDAMLTQLTKLSPAVLPIEAIATRRAVNDAECLLRCAKLVLQTAIDELPAAEPERSDEILP